MKIMSVLILLSVSLIASADDPLPSYISSVKGVILDSLTERSDFSLEPGTLRKCERRVVGADWVLYDCAVEGAVSQVKDSRGKTQTFQFDKVHVSFRYSKSVDFFNEYYFSGEWRNDEEPIALSSQVTLVLWYARKTPDKVKGSIILKDFSLERAIQAKQ